MSRTASESNPGTQPRAGDPAVCRSTTTTSWPEPPYGCVRAQPYVTVWSVRRPECRVLGPRGVPRAQGGPALVAGGAGGQHADHRGRVVQPAGEGGVPGLVQRHPDGGHAEFLGLPVVPLV